MEYHQQQVQLLKEAQVAATSVVALGYIIGVGMSILINFFSLSLANYAVITLAGSLIFFIVFHLAENSIIKVFSKERYFHFYLTTLIFGQITHWGVYTLFVQADYTLVSFKVFLLNNIIFHFGEFFFVCLSHPRNLCWKSFLINHSPAYNIAFAVALVEYFLGAFFPSFFLFCLHDNKYVIFVGLSLSMFGHILRIGAQQTAKSNFTHLVQSQKREDHVLVTHGVYSFSRHPSYLGFFSYSLGGQLILGNIFCFFAYTYVLFKFFMDRIVDEEYHLVKFFGEEYVKYRERVPIRIPFMEYFMYKLYVYDD